jgi:hypothetical protein
VRPGTSGLESFLSEIKLDVSRGRVAVTPSRQQYAYFQMNIMAISVVEFSREGYKIRKVFG